MRPSDGQILECNNVWEDDPERMAGRSTYLYTGPADSVG